MKKAITLPQFVKDFPKEKCFSKIDSHKISNVEYSKNLPYEQKIKFVGYTIKTIERLSYKDEHIYYIVENISIHRSGKNFYPVVSSKDSIYISRNEVSILCSPCYVKLFLNHLGIDWFRDLNGYFDYLFCNKTILRQIITNRIYNEETFCKSVASSFRIKNISWRYVKKYFESRCRFSLTDIAVFTKNVEQSIDVLYMSRNQVEYTDLVQCAIKLNQVVDLTWSKKRIAEEHKKQINRLLEKEIEDKENAPIYETNSFSFPSTTRLLNTEKEVFIEAKTMHHCLYDCYFNRINNHKYIAFHLDFPEDCTIGITICSGKPKLDQIYRKFDQPVLDSTKEYAIKFINSYKDELTAMFDQNSDCVDICCNEDLPY